MNSRIWWIVLTAIITLASFGAVNAQETLWFGSFTDPRAWGIWQGTWNWGWSEESAMMVIFPDGSYVLRTDTDLNREDTSIPDPLILGTPGWVPNSAWIDVSYSFEDPTTMVINLSTSSSTAIYSTFWNIRQIVPEEQNLCPTVRSWMIPGLAGGVTLVGTPMNLRSEPTTSSVILEELDTTERFWVIDNPTCAEGYTWWFVESLVTGQSGWLAEGTVDLGHFIYPIPNIEDAHIFENYAASGPTISVPITSVISEPAEAINCESSAPGLYPGATTVTSADASVWGVTRFDSVHTRANSLVASLFEGTTVDITGSPDCDNEGNVMWPVEFGEWSGWVYEYALVPADPTVIYYLPGSYPFITQLGQAIANGENMTGPILNIIGVGVYVKDVAYGQNGPLKLICALTSAITAGEGFISDAAGENEATCMLVEVITATGEMVIAGEIVAGPFFVIAEILNSPARYIDPWLSDIHTFIDSHPLLRTYCSLAGTDCSSMLGRDLTTSPAELVIGEWRSQTDAAAPHPVDAWGHEMGVVVRPSLWLYPDGSALIEAQGLEVAGYYQRRDGQLIVYLGSWGTYRLLSVDQELMVLVDDRDREWIYLRR